MEGTWWWVTAVAPVAWGANYVVTRQLLPGDHPLWGSALRAVPAAVVLLLLARTLPRGVWWWRAPLLGVVNIGAFFLLVHVASQALASGVAASVMALSPLALALAGWVLLGLGGVSLVVGGGGSVVAHETLASGQVAGVGIVLLAVALATTSRPRDVGTTVVVAPRA